MGSYSSAMKFQTLSFLLWAAPHWITAQKEFVCSPGLTKEKIYLKEGETLEYRTQDGEEYPPNVFCLLSIRKPRKSKCRLTFDCSKFNITSPTPPPTCKGGDFLEINKNKYCQTDAPLVITKSKQLKVLFMTNLNDVNTGAVCR